MPLPMPHAGEARNDFLARCMADPATQDITGADATESQSRRVAACERQFDDRKSAEEGGEGFGLKAMRDVAIGDETKGEVSAVIATFDEVDNDAEVIPAGAIPDGMKVTVSSYNHDTIMGHMLGTGTPDAPPVGKGVIRTMGNKAVAQLHYFMETQRGREAFQTVKAMGPDQAWSFGYRKIQVDKPSAELAAKGAKRVLTKLGPLLDGSMECSPVKMPGGVGTGTLSAKAVTTETPEAKAAKPTASVDGKEYPAEDFAYVPDPEKPSTWKFPIFDAAHVRNALARWDQADLPAADKAKVRARIEEAARKFGIDTNKKSVDDVALEHRVTRVKRTLGLT